MGMFNSIYADLLCPKKKKISKDTEIQIKWQTAEYRLLEVYHLGDILEGLLPEYNNTWIRTDYICNICSKHTKGYNGSPFIRVDDQKRHYVFVRIGDSKICDILTAKQFKKKHIKKFVKYW